MNKLVATAILIAFFLSLGVVSCLRKARGMEKLEVGQIGLASWYSTKESKGVMANGEIFKDGRYTCATWAFDFGTMLRVVSLHTNKEIVVEVTDRGPGQPKCSCLKGPQRIIDLSKVAFERLAPLSSGLISVRVEQIGQN